MTRIGLGVSYTNTTSNDGNKTAASKKGRFSYGDALRTNDMAENSCRHSLLSKVMLHKMQSDILGAMRGKAWLPGMHERLSALL